MKKIGLLRRQSRKLSRTQRETVFLNIIRPTLEYGSIIYDNCCQKDSARLDSIQHQFTPAYLGQTYTRMHNNVSTRTTWLTLNSVHRVFVPHCRVVCYQQSYFPSVIKLWNGLPSDLVQSNSIALFKIAIRQHLNLSSRLSLTRNLKHFSSGRLGKILTQMICVKIFPWQIRLGLSPLNYQLFEYNINDNPFCPQCGSHFETAMHYFCVCSHYETDRILLKSAVNILLSYLLHI